MDTTIADPCRPTLADQVYAGILSQAVTGELVGMLNFISLAELSPEMEDKEDALEHAASERRHAQVFRRAARELGVPIVEDVNASYWRRVRSAFLEWAGRRDRLACLYIQELILESFAVSLYQSVGEVAPGSLGESFRRIAKEEEGHLQHALDLLREEYRRDPPGFEAKAKAIHDSVMPALAEMVAKDDPGGHCGLCGKECLKKSLPVVRLSIVTLRGKALKNYLRTLDALGLPGEETLPWVAALPV
jgi:rubrerythrin